MEEIERRCLSPLSHFSPPSYYLKKQRALRLSTCNKSRARGQGRPARAHTGLTFFCQAARLSGLSSTQLARSLHTLYRTGAPSAGRGRGVGGPRNRGGTPRKVERMLQVIRSLAPPASAGGPPRTVPASSSSGSPFPGGRSPYAQIPNLTGRQRPERRISNRAPGPDVRFPKPHQPGRPKLPPNLGPLSKGETQAQTRSSEETLRTGQMGRRRDSRWGVIGRQQRLA